ncbi:hypothetical protein BGZ76_009742 [Entomortierella beljakovae]|nr:hypothetical protein BGZ76_009742 [Entomortierella beljakovae]
MEDPFILIKNASTLFASWKRILQTVASADNEELIKTREELFQIIANIEQDLEDLDDAVKAVIENPSRFNLTTRESNSRKQFVDQTRRKVQDMRTTLEKPVKIGNEQIDRLALLEDAGTSSPRGYQKPSRRENMMYSNTKFVEQEAQQQQMLLQEQDQQLDGVMVTVLNMREIATTMNSELEDQSMLLDDLDEHVDRTSGGLQKAMRRMNNFIKQNEGKDMLKQPFNSIEEFRGHEV